MSVKTYQCIGYTTLEHRVVIDGVKVTIEFKGGGNYPRKTFGIYSTDDKAIQKALESSRSFKTLYRIIRDNDELFGDETPQLTHKEQVVKLQQENADLKAEINILKAALKEVEDAKIPKDVIAVKEVFNAQQAKEYLAENFEELEIKNLPNKATVLKRAEERNICFPDWIDND